jgi:NitT/TauT family transport system ATP-binding protein
VPTELQSRPLPAGQRREPDGTPAVSLQDVSRSYPGRRGGGAVQALAGVSLHAAPGELVAVVGPSGCGKSTLLMIAAGLLAPSSGAVLVSGRKVDRPRTDIGIVFQNPVLLDWRTALGNVMLQAEARKMNRKEAQARAGTLLESVGLGGFEERFPHELSGGMRQRVSICRALIHNPDHLLMDEPFGALDALTRDQLVLDLEALVRERRMTVLFITHSIAEAVFLSDRVIVMTPRPGGIDRIIDIKLPRPRTLAMRETSEFAEYSRQILDLFLARGVLREHRAKS